MSINEEGMRDCLLLLFQEFGRVGTNWVPSGMSWWISSCVNSELKVWNVTALRMSRMSQPLLQPGPLEISGVCLYREHVPSIDERADLEAEARVLLCKDRMTISCVVLHSK